MVKCGLSPPIIVSRIYTRLIGACCWWLDGSDHEISGDIIPEKESNGSASDSVKSSTSWPGYPFHRNVGISWPLQLKRELS